MKMNQIKSKMAPRLSKRAAVLRKWKEEMCWSLLILAANLIGILIALAITHKLSASVFGAWAGIYCLPLAVIYFVARVWQARSQEDTKRIDTLMQMLMWGGCGVWCRLLIHLGRGVLVLRSL